jgi:hypothetical protein
MMKVSAIRLRRMSIEDGLHAQATLLYSRAQHCVNLLCLLLIQNHHLRSTVAGPAIISVLLC